MQAFGRFIRLSLCFISLLQALGGQWIALQGIAWTQMLVQNSRHFTLKESLARTFDGKHPCEVCHKIKAGRSQERSKPQSTLPEFRPVDLIFAQVMSVKQRMPDQKVSYLATSFASPPLLTFPPQSPPPENTRVLS